METIFNGKWKVQPRGESGAGATSMLNNAAAKYPIYRGIDTHLIDRHGKNIDDFQVGNKATYLEIDRGDTIKISPNTYIRKYPYNDTSDIYWFYTESGRCVWYTGIGDANFIFPSIIAVIPKSHLDSTPIKISNDRYTIILVNSQGDAGNAIERQYFRWSITKEGHNITAYLDLPDDGSDRYVDILPYLIEKVKRNNSSLDVFINNKTGFVKDIDRKISI